MFKTPTVSLINLTHRKDKLEYSLFNLREYELPYKVISVTPPTDKGTFTKLGARGCFESHMKALRENIDNPDDMFIIAEDDFYPTIHFRICFPMYINLFRESSYDYINFYDTHQSDEDKLFLRDSETFYNHFYAVKTKSILKIITETERNIFDSLDATYRRLAKKKVILTGSTSKTIVKQNRFFDSDIGKRNIDRLSVVEQFNA